MSIWEKAISPATCTTGLSNSCLWNSKFESWCLGPRAALAQCHTTRNGRQRYTVSRLLSCQHVALAAASCLKRQKMAMRHLRLLSWLSCFGRDITPQAAASPIEAAPPTLSNLAGRDASSMHSRNILGPSRAVSRAMSRVASRPVSRPMSCTQSKAGSVVSGLPSESCCCFALGGQRSNSNGCWLFSLRARGFSPTSSMVSSNHMT
jgi:hypothetical protein